MNFEINFKINWNNLYIFIIEMLQSVEKLNKTCVLKFTRDKIFLIVSKIELTELQVWGQVAVVSKIK